MRYCGISPSAWCPFLPCLLEICTIRSGLSVDGNSLGIMFSRFAVGVQSTLEPHEQAISFVYLQFSYAKLFDRQCVVFLFRE